MYTRTHTRTRTHTHTHSHTHCSRWPAWGLSKGQSWLNDSNHTYKELFQTYECVISHIWMSHGTDDNVSCRTHECVLSLVCVEPSMQHTHEGLSFHMSVLPSVWGSFLSYEGFSFHMRVFPFIWRSFLSYKGFSFHIRAFPFIPRLLHVT